MMPAILAALSIFRETDLGSILNLYVTPITRSDFLSGKQIPYIVLTLLNFLLMSRMTVTLFGVLVKGNYLALVAATIPYVRKSRPVRHLFVGAGVGQSGTFW